MKYIPFQILKSFQPIAKRCPDGYHQVPGQKEGTCGKFENGKFTGELWSGRKEEVDQFVIEEYEKNKDSPKGKKKDIAYESFVKIGPDHEAYKLVTGLKTGNTPEAIATRQALMDWSDKHDGMIPFVEYEPFKIGDSEFHSGVTTYTMFTDDKGNYTPERQQVHMDIVMKLVSRLPKAEGRKARVAFTGGGSASGKGALDPQLAEYLGVDMEVKRKKGESDEDYEKRARKEREKRMAIYKIDPDAIMELIPEYREYVKRDMVGGASMFHKEASDISKLAYDYATRHGLDFVYDGTFSSEKPLQWAKDIDKEQYDSYLVGKLTDVDICKERSKKRFVKGGYKGRFPRIVPTAVLEKSNNGFRDNITNNDMDELFGKGHWKTIEDSQNKK